MGRTSQHIAVSYADGARWGQEYHTRSILLGRFPSAGGSACTFWVGLFFFFFLFLREVGEARRVSGTACFARNRFSAWSQITTGLPKLGREEPTPSGSGRGMIDQCQLKVCPLRLPGENIGDSLTNDAMICCNVRDVVGLCDPRAVSPSSGSSCPLQFKCDELLNRFGTVFRWSQGRRLTRMSI